MSEIKASFTPGWVTCKDNMNITDNQQKVLKFYLFGTPCSETSSCGRNMQQRGWPKDVWKNHELRNYLLATAKLQAGLTYQKADKLEEMSDKATIAKLQNKFQTARECNRVLFYSDCKRVDMLNILYYIRCALAHGRFEIYTNQNGCSTYVLEAITKKRGSDDYIVRARMVLRETTLIDWAETIMGGSKEFNQRYAGLRQRIGNEIIAVIKSNSTCKKKDISDILPYEKSLVFQELNALKSEGRVFYDNSQKRWRLFEVNTK